MSVYENAQNFWEHFSSRQPEIEQALTSRDYPGLVRALEPVQESAMNRLRVLRRRRRRSV